ncbi:MAG: disulfide bond formation protein B [Aquificales bacterium]|nr:disulfide bond formation protein B [Aquificales bacterium]
MNKTKTITFFQDYGGILALVVAITATLGSLYYSEIAGFVPCTLCWYQRILMYPLTLITLVGVLKQDEYLPYYVLPFSVLGMGVSGYHTLIQSGVFSHPTTCTEGVPCSLRYVNYAGFITIPLLAFTAFVLITAVMIATLWAFRKGLLAAEEDESGAAESDSTGFQWGAALGLVVLLLVALVALAAFRTMPSQTTGVSETAVTQARQLTTHIPPPTSERQKCKHCSIQPICLPDEVQKLRIRN